MRPPRLAVLASVVALGLVWACGSQSDGPAAGTGGLAAGGSPTSGGANATGGTPGGGGQAAMCSSIAPCGGNLVGSWSVTSSCLKVSGQLDLSLAGTACKSAPVSGNLTVTGTWTANSNGTVSDNTTTSGSEQITLAQSCLTISSTPVTCEGAANVLLSLGYASLTCAPAAGGGCDCSGTVQQVGGLGLVSPSPSTSGSFATAGNVVTIDGDAKYSYCASASELKVAPQTTNATITGSVVFQRNDSGAGGGAGSAGAGGTVGTGGTVGSGGVIGSGGTGGVTGTGGVIGTGGGGSAVGPCDIYKTGGTPCVAAHSTVRAVFGAYGGNLYQVRNAAGTTKDIKALTPGGSADAAAQDTFCAGTNCVITIIYDQSGKGNDLYYQGADSKVGGKDKPASATGESLKLGGKKVYSLYINPGNSYWVDGSKTGMPLGAEPEGMYMVTNSKHFNSGCCFDYGNSEADRKADGAGAMDALNFSNTTAWGSGAGSGPWIMADLEYGLFAQNNTNKNPNNPSQTSTYVTAVLKNNGKTEFAIRGGDANAGKLSTYYKGALPGGWSPMKKQGAIVLGSGGDCCATNTNLSDGTFYEGCIVSGYPSDATEDAVQSNIVAAGYGK